MKVILKVFIGSILSLLQIQAVLASDEFEGINYVYAMLIANGETQVAAKGITDDEIENPLLWDMLAEKLPQAIKVGHQEVDYHELIANALMVSGSKRYQKVYEDSISQIPPGKFSRKKRLKSNKLKADDKESYVKGSIDFDDITKRLKEFQRKNSPRDSFSYFYDAPYCKPVDDILREFGYPETIKVRSTISGRHFFVGRLDLRQLVFDYRDNTKVMLTRKTGVGWCLMRSLPSVGGMGFAKDLEEKAKKALLELRYMIWHWNRSSMVNARRVLRNYPQFRQHLEDEIVLRIWWGRNVKDDLTEDGLAILFKQLKKTPSPRYRDAMGIIAETSESFKLRLIAKSYLRKLSDEEVDQFVPSIKYMYLASIK